MNIERMCVRACCVHASEREKDTGRQRKFGMRMLMLGGQTAFNWHYRKINETDCRMR